MKAQRHRANPVSIPILHPTVERYNKLRGHRYILRTGQITNIASRTKRSTLSENERSKFLIKGLVYNCSGKALPACEEVRARRVSARADDVCIALESNTCMHRFETPSVLQYTRLNRILLLLLSLEVRRLGPYALTQVVMIVQTGLQNVVRYRTKLVTVHPNASPYRKHNRVHAVQGAPKPKGGHQQGRWRAAHLQCLQAGAPLDELHKHPSPQTRLVAKVPRLLRRRRSSRNGGLANSETGQNGRGTGSISCGGQTPQRVRGRGRASESCER